MNLDGNYPYRLANFNDLPNGSLEPFQSQNLTQPNDDYSHASDGKSYDEDQTTKRYVRLPLISKRDMIVFRSEARSPNNRPPT